MAEPEEVKEEINEEVEPENPQPEPEQPEPEEPSDQPEDVPEEPEQPEEQQPPEPKLSRRADLRIKKLLEENKRLRGQQQPTPPKGLDYGQALEADPETIQQLEQDRRKYGETLYNEGLKQAQSMQFRTRLEIDTPRIQSKFPQLNPDDKENFDPVITDALNTHYLTLVGYDEQTDTVQNSNLRYSEFVEAQYELAEALANKKVAQSRQNITRQVANTGLRPDGSAAKRLNLNQDPSTMNDEELEAYGAQLGLSTKKR